MWCFELNSVKTLLRHPGICRISVLFTSVNTAVSFCIFVCDQWKCLFPLLHENGIVEIRRFSVVGFLGFFFFKSGFGNFLLWTDFSLGSSAMT